MNKRLVSVLTDVFELRAEQIVPQLTKDEVGSWDSLKQMNLVISLEQTFDIALEIPDIIRMDSVANIIEVLTSKGGYTLQLEGSVALITGGAKGLGLAIATYLQVRGAQVVVADFDKDALAILPEKMEGCVLDVTRLDDAKIMVKEIVERHGHIDILVNNAGVIYSEPMVNIMNASGMMHDYDRFRKTITANLDSVFIMTSAVVEQMVLRRTRGVIVNISSISAGGNEGQTAYSAAKAGVNAMTVTWSKELGILGIRCNAVAPGFMDTDSTCHALNESIVKHIKNNTPLRRLGRAEEVAQAVLSVITNDFINGVVLNVDGGLTI